MTEEKKCAGIKSCIVNYLVILVIIIMGTGIMAQWNAWSGYKIYQSDKYNIKIHLQDGKQIDVPAGQEVKVYRTSDKVEVFTPDRKTRDIYYNMVRIEFLSK